MKANLTKKEIEYLKYKISVDLDSYLMNRRELTKGESIQHMKIIPKDVWEFGKLNEIDCGFKLKFLEKLYKQFVNYGGNK